MCLIALSFPVGNVRMALVCGGLLASDAVAATTVLLELRKGLPNGVLIGARGLLSTALLCSGLLAASGLIGLLLYRLALNRAADLGIIALGGSAWLAALVLVMRSQRAVSRSVP